MTRFRDKFKNVLAALGTERDKANHSEYGTPFESDEQLINAYRGAWLPRKIIDIPAMDSVRKWREWQAEADQIGAIEAEEKRLGLRKKALQAQVRARLFGGAGIYIGTGDRDVDKPLNPERIQQGGIKYLTTLTRRQLTPGDIDTDPLSPGYGSPLYYRVTGGRDTVDIHPSRIAVFIGNMHPDPEISSGLSYGWGDPVLTAIWDAVRNADSTSANIASLVFEAKIDVIRIPDFMVGMSDPEYREDITERFLLAAKAKGINGALLLDKEEEYDQKSANFSSLNDILMSFMQLVSGAADIPITRLLGQSPGGLNASGEHDLKNYYDRVSSMQELETGPAMSILDECLIRSALGNRPDELHYVWSSLWQSSDSEKAEIGHKAAQTIKLLSETRLFPDDALSEASVNMLTERSVLPGLEAAVNEFEPGEDDLSESGAMEEQDDPI